MLFRDIRRLAEERWPFTPHGYPVLARLVEPHDRQRFSGTHVLLHWVKSTGKVAALLEIVDHRDLPLTEPERQEAAQLIAKMLVNLFQFAKLYGVTDEAIRNALTHGEV
jgi:hypothetical protein